MSEPKTPYEESVDDFFDTLKRSSASESQLILTLSSLVRQSVPQNTDITKYANRWSRLYTYDVDGILDEAGGEVERDEDGAALEMDTDHIITTKLHLLGRVTAFLVGSGTSILTNEQRQAFFLRATSYADRKREEYTQRSKARDMESHLRLALLPCIAYNFELAEAGNEANHNIEQKLEKGQFLVRLLLGRWPRSAQLRAYEEGFRRLEASS